MSKKTSFLQALAKSEWALLPLSPTREQLKEAGVEPFVLEKTEQGIDEMQLPITKTEDKAIKLMAQIQREEMDLLTYGYCDENKIFKLKKKLKSILKIKPSTLNT